MKFEVKSDQFTDYPIIGVNQGSRIFTIAGDQTAWFQPNDVFAVSGSTGNDGSCTVVTAVLNSGNTDITVSEAIPDATADGDISWKPKVLEFFEDTPFDIRVGDTLEIRTGCNKTLEACRRQSSATSTTCGPSPTCRESTRSRRRTRNESERGDTEGCAVLRRGALASSGTLASRCGHSRMVFSVKKKGTITDLAFRRTEPAQCVPCFSRQ